MTRLVVIGDIHLKSGHARNAERLRQLDAIIEHGLTLDDLCGWIVLGDVFDAKSTVDDRNAFAERVVRMASAAPVWVVRGNHDAEGDLLIFGKLETDYPVTVRETPDVVWLPLTAGKTLRVLHVFMLPWPSEVGLASQGVAPADIVPASAALLDAIFMDAAQKLSDARAAGALTLFAGHVNVRGAIACSGQPQVGQGIEIDAAMLSRLGDCPKLAGHIHLPQEIGGAVYAGSVSANDWSEIQRKRFLIVSFADDGSWSLESVPLDTPPLHHVEGFLSREGFAYDYPDKPESWKGCEVRVRAKFKQNEKALLEMAKATILAEFAEASRLELEMVAVVDDALRSPAVAAAKTLAEKLEAWGTESRVVVPAALVELLPALEHADSEALIAAERAAADAVLNPPVIEERAAVA